MRRVFVLGAALAVAASGQAAWTLHALPAPGFGLPDYLGVADGRLLGSHQFGRTSIATASLPDGAPFSLHPGTVGAIQPSDTVAQGGAGGQFVGFYRRLPGGGPAPLLWPRLQPVAVDLMPAGGGSGMATDTDGAMQVGWVIVDGAQRAFSWTGSASTARRLGLPSGFSSWSVARAIAGNIIVGSARGPAGERAVLWNKTTGNATVVPITGDVTRSAATDTTGVVTGGFYSLRSDGLNTRAALWNAFGMVQLHSSAWRSSEVRGVLARPTNQTFAVGSYTLSDGRARAAAWGPRTAFVDLHRLLPTSFVSSQALAIGADGPSGAWVVGRASIASGTTVPVVWRYRP